MSILVIGSMDWSFIDPLVRQAVVVIAPPLGGR